VPRIVRRGGNKELNGIVVVTVFAYFIWIDIAMALYTIYLGLNPSLLPVTYAVDRPGAVVRNQD